MTLAEGAVERTRRHRGARVVAQVTDGGLTLLRRTGHEPGWELVAQCADAVLSTVGGEEGR